MGRVRIGVDEADRDGLDLFSEQSSHRLLRIGARQRAYDLARRVHPLVHHHPQVALHQRRRLLPREVVEPRHPQVAQLQHVAEALAGDEPHPRAGQLQDRVRRHRGAVHDLGDLARRHAMPDEHRLEPFDDGERIVIDARRDLLRDDPPAVVEQHDVGERAADVDADPVAAHALLPRVTNGMPPPRGRRPWTRTGRKKPAPVRRGAGESHATASVRASPRLMEGGVPERARGPAWNRTVPRPSTALAGGRPHQRLPLMGVVKAHGCHRTQCRSGWFGAWQAKPSLSGSRHAANRDQDRMKLEIPSKILWIRDYFARWLDAGMNSMGVFTHHAPRGSDGDASAKLARGRAPDFFNTCAG